MDLHRFQPSDGALKSKGLEGIHCAQVSKPLMLICLVILSSSNIICVL